MDHKRKTEMFIQSALDFKSGNVFTLQTAQETAKKARICKGMEAISELATPCIEGLAPLYILIN